MAQRPGDARRPLRRAIFAARQGEIGKTERRQQLPRQKTPGQILRAALRHRARQMIRQRKARLGKTLVTILRQRKMAARHLAG